ncbi:hypothetical protein GYMLUDRAFT_253124 [Collybiopsis luxurians FD-317 M1]|uniref:Uncharacterized protein n=1 Tax=Collybiopsis luxurians FD-317 M1 TaxID=944289 RepID=A0A0D0BLF8_9AGAR|nr:hypothetical protein GYMLUDRAFT_253124 [Collybiopsis luxurians FD-317 M1]
MPALLQNGMIDSANSAERHGILRRTSNKDTTKYSVSQASTITATGNQPGWTNDGTLTRSDGADDNKATTSETSKAALGGSIAGSVVGTALLLGILWWFWRRGRQRLRWQWRRKFEERPVIDWEDSAQVIQTLPTPAIHLALAVPPQSHLLSDQIGTVARSPSMPPRYWQIHNSSSAVSLSRKLFSNKKINPSTTYGRAPDPTSNSQPLTPGVTVGNLLSQRPSANVDDLFTESTCTSSSPLSPDPPSSPLHSSSAGSHDHSYNPSRMIAVVDSSYDEPLVMTRTRSRAESELEIRHLRQQVEILTEENTRLGGHRALLDRGTGQAEAPPAYTGG